MQWKTKQLGMFAIAIILWSRYQELELELQIFIDLHYMKQITATVFINAPIIIDKAQIQFGYQISVSI